MSQRLLETDFPSTNPQVKRSLSREYRPANLNLRPLSTSGSMPKNLTSVTSASEWQYEPTFRPGSMSRVQTSFNTVGNNPSASSNSNKPQPRPLQNSGVIIGRTGSLRKAFTTSDEEDEATNSIIYKIHRGTGYEDTNSK